MYMEQKSEKYMTSSLGSYTSADGDLDSAKKTRTGIAEQAFTRSQTIRKLQVL